MMVPPMTVIAAADRSVCLMTIVTIRFYNRVNLVTNCPNWTIEEPRGQRQIHHTRSGSPSGSTTYFEFILLTAARTVLRPPVASPVAARPFRKLRRERWTSRRHAGNRDQAGTISVIGRRRRGAKRVQISGSGLLSQR
jgi:hypothetical protein